MITLFEKFKFYKKGLDVAYSAVVLDDESKRKMLYEYIYNKPKYLDWIKIAHHMTICLGELPEHLKKYWLGEEVTLTVMEIGYSDKAVAVKVNGFFSISKQKQEEGDGPKFDHITLAINSIDAKPSDSNNITEWYKVEPLKINGKVEEIHR